MTSDSVSIFIVFVVVGLVLIGAELFVPGGILGFVGCVALVGAIITSYFAFPNTWPFIAIAIFFLAGVSILLWMKIFPKTRIGKLMTAQSDLADAKGTNPELEGLVGKEGIVISSLHPSGFAKIDGKRIDVVTQGGMIEKDTAIVVIEVEGNRVVVKQKN